MKSKNGPVGVRFTDQQRQKLIKLSEKQAGTVSETVRGIVAEFLNGYDLTRQLRFTGEEIIAANEKRMEAFMLAFLDEQEKGKGGRSQEAQAPTENPALDMQTARPADVQRSLAALKAGAYDHELTDAVRARVAEYMEKQSRDCPHANWISEQEAQLLILRRTSAPLTVPSRMGTRRGNQ